MIRYGYDLGCRFKGVPHEMTLIHENPQIKVERCQLCNQSFRWRKGYKQRIDNKEYVKAHLRSFAQKFGATKRVYKRLYSRDETIIRI